MLRCKSKAGWIYERPSEIVSVREVKLPIILCVITADDRRSLGQSGSTGFMAFFKLKQLSYILCPHQLHMKKNSCRSISFLIELTKATRHE